MIQCPYCLQRNKNDDRDCQFCGGRLPARPGIDIRIESAPGTEPSPGDRFVELQYARHLKESMVVKSLFEGESFATHGTAFDVPSVSEAAAREKAYK